MHTPLSNPINEELILQELVQIRLLLIEVRDLLGRPIVKVEPRVERDWGKPLHMHWNEMSTTTE